LVDYSLQLRHSGLSLIIFRPIIPHKETKGKQGKRKAKSEDFVDYL
jgi:hypothetical protein